MADPDTPDTPDDAQPDEAFDAVKAAAELAAALGEQPASASGEGGSNYTAILEDEVEALQKALAEKDQQLADKDAAVRAAEAKANEARAEVARARTRLERDAKAEIERKRRAVIISFLEVADDLGRAAKELEAGDVPEALAKGVEVVVQEFAGVLKHHGVQHRPSLGQMFDSAHHEAIGTAPATDEVPDGTIAAVLSEGYDIGEDTLRAARVVVAKG